MNRLLSRFFHCLKAGISIIAFSLIQAQTPVGTQISNVAQVTFEYQNGVQMMGNSNTVITTVEPGYLLRITKAVASSYMLPNETNIFHLDVYNDGNISANNITVTDTLVQPPVNISLSDTLAGIVGNIILWEIPHIESGETTSLDIIFDIQPDTEIGTQFTNTAWYSALDGSLGYSNTVNVEVGLSPDLDLQHTVNKAVCYPGDTLQYTIVLRNTGNVPITNTIVYDHLPESVTVISISENGTGTDIIEWDIGTLDRGEEITSSVEVVVDPQILQGERLISTASVTNSEEIFRNSIAISDLIIPDQQITLDLTADPHNIPADGVSSSEITAVILDDSGYPVLDGTIVIFSTNNGWFTNGLTEINGSTFGGIATVTLISSYSNDTIIEAVVIGIVQNFQNNPIVDEVSVWFYPASISGYVTDFTTGMPIPNVTSETYYSDNSLVWSTQTDNEGRYFIPISVSDDYTIRNSSQDGNGNQIISENTIQLVVPTLPGFAHILNFSSISGIFSGGFRSNFQPLNGVSVYLLQNGVTVDSTTTNPLGQFIFDALHTGEYTIQGITTIDSKKWIGTEDGIILDEGEWLLNTNITMSPQEISISKYALASGYTTEDTIQYNIVLANPAFAKLIDVFVTDSLPTMLSFQSASDNAVFMDNNVTWNVGDIMPFSSDTLKIFATVVTPIADNTLLRNVAVASSPTTEDSQDDFIINISSSLSVELIKTAPIEVFPNDTLNYQMEYMNTGSGTLTNVFITDHLPSTVTFLDATHPYEYDLSTHTITWAVGTLEPDIINSLSLTTRVDSNLPDGEQIVNNANITCSENVSGTSSTTTTNILPMSITLSANPPAILGNGLNNSLLTAHLYSFLGNPIEKSLPMSFFTDEGSIPAELDTVYTENGVAQSILVSEVIFDETITATVLARTDYSLTQSASDTTQVLFYPGAIVGVVLDINQNPIAGAIVNLFNSSGELVGTAITDANGGYLIPVFNYDLYTITITTIDNFGNPVTVEQSLNVSQEIISENVEIPNLVSVSGWLINGLLGTVIEEAGIQIILTGNTSELIRTGDLLTNTVTDTTYSSEKGFYTFSGLSPGEYQIHVFDNGVSSYGNGSITIGDLSAGNYVINANIPLEYTDLSIFKTVDREFASIGDTLIYQLAFGTSYTSYSDTTYIVDYLPANLGFIEESLILTDGILFDQYDPFTREIWFHTPGFSVGEMDTVQFSTVVENLPTFGYSDIIENQASLFTVEDTLVTANDPRTNAITHVIEEVLEITKEANRNTVTLGEFITYTLTIENKSAVLPAYGLAIHDILPKGFRYKDRSSWWEDNRTVEPDILVTGNSRQNLTWVVSDTLQPGQHLQLKYRANAGLNATIGEKINLAYAVTYLSNEYYIESKTASATVILKPDGIRSKGLIIGKVYYDTNLNGIHDNDERTANGVELITETGIRVVTDSFGKYSIPNVNAGEHVIRVNQRSLPEFSHIILNSNDFLGDPLSRLVKMSPGGIAKVNFALEEEVPGNVWVNICDNPIIDLQFSTLDSIYQIPSNDTVNVNLPPRFESGEAMLSKEDISDLREYANLLRNNKQLSLHITGHTDNRIPAKNSKYRDNMELSVARANFIKESLVKEYNISNDRITVDGKGDTEPIIENYSSDERRINRRVELSFRNQFKQDEILPVFEIGTTLNYNSKFPVADVEYYVEIPQDYFYVPNSAMFDGNPITPAQFNCAELIFDLGNIAGKMSHLLTFKLEQDINSGLISQATVKGHLKYLSYNNDVIATEEITGIISSQYQGLEVVRINPKTAFSQSGLSFTDDEQNKFSLLSQLINNNPDIKISVEGYCHSSDQQEDPFMVSYQNAQSVHDYLITNSKINPKMISVIGFGDQSPYFDVAGNDIVRITLHSEEIISSEPVGAPVSNAQTFIQIIPEDPAKQQSIDYCNCGENQILISSHETSTPIMDYTLSEPLFIERAISFKSGSNTLSTTDKKVIEMISMFMNWQDKTDLTIIGHADNQPITKNRKFKNNNDLSLARARAVRDALVEQFGIDSIRITLKGEGHNNPIGSNEDPIGRAMNRRVDLLFHFPSTETCEENSLAMEVKIQSTNNEILENSHFTVTVPPGFIYGSHSGVINGRDIEPILQENSVITWSIPDVPVDENLSLAYQLKPNSLEVIKEVSIVTGRLDIININSDVRSIDGISNNILTHVHRNMFTTVIHYNANPFGIPEIDQSTFDQLDPVGRFLEWQQKTMLTIECWVSDELLIRGWDPRNIVDYLVSKYDIQIDRIKILPTNTSRNSKNRIELIIGSHFINEISTRIDYTTPSKYDILPAERCSNDELSNISHIKIKHDHTNHLWLTANYSDLPEIDSLTIELFLPAGFSILKSSRGLVSGSSIIWKIEKADLEKHSLLEFNIWVPRDFPELTPIRPVIEGYHKGRKFQIKTQNEIIFTD